jgi:hypothetical protein
VHLSLIFSLRSFRKEPDANMRERVYASVFFFHEDDSLSFTNDLFTKSDMVLATSGV